MIPSHRILPSNAPPMGSDRVLRHTSGNANYVDDAAEDSDASASSDVSLPEPSNRPKSRRFVDDRRDARVDRHAKNGRLRALAQDPSSTFVAKYEDRLTNRKFERRERIAEAILPDEKAQWQHHMLEEQAKEQQRKRAYLERERKELVKHGDNAGQVVWSRVLDDAYQIAIRCVPPILGKKKMSIPDGQGGTRLAGRNELISRKILQLTGQVRFRKQISSHNQVLRKFRVKNPHGYDVGTLEKGKDSRHVRTYDTKNLQWDDENGQLIYVSPNQQGSLQPMPNGMRSYSDCLPLSAHISSGPPSHSVTIQSVDFAMNQYAPESEDRYLELVEHQYTTLQSTTGARPQPLDEVLDWQTMFPSLANLDKKNELQHCDIILFESSLAIGQPPRGKSRLSIKFDLGLYCHPGYRDWSIRTTFCEDKGVPKYAVSNTIDTTTRKDAHRTELGNVPFTSHWWRDLFSGIMKRRWEREQFDERKIEEAGHGHCGDDCDTCRQLQAAAAARLQEEDEYSNRYLQELSVTQEVFAVDRPALKQQRRVAVFLWRFRRAWPGEAATTIWRRLMHPNQAHLQAPMQAPSHIPAHPLTPLDQGRAPGTESDYLGHDPQMAPHEQTIGYDVGASAYWDPSWTGADNGSYAQFPHIASADDSHAVQHFPPHIICPTQPQALAFDPSPSAHDHDSGYASQGTSFASRTPMLHSLRHHPQASAVHGGGEESASYGTGYGMEQSQASTDGTAGAVYGINAPVSHVQIQDQGQNEYPTADQQDQYSYSDMALAGFDLSSYEHSHDPSIANKLSHLQHVTDPNLFNFTGGHIHLNFGLGGEDSGAAGLNISHDSHGSNTLALSQGSQPATTPQDEDGPSSQAQLHAPQPLHPPGALSFATTNATPAGSFSAAPGVSFASTTSSMSFPPASSATIVPYASTAGFATIFPASHCLPTARMHTSQTHSPHAEASMLLHLAHGGHAHGRPHPSTSRPHSQGQLHDSHAHTHIEESVECAAGPSASATPAPHPSALWPTEHLTDLPGGLFLDVGGAVGPDAAAAVGDFPTSRDRVHETGRLLGQLLGTRDLMDGSAAWPTTSRDRDEVPSGWQHAGGPVPRERAWPPTTREEAMPRDGGWGEHGREMDPQQWPRAQTDEEEWRIRAHGARGMVGV